jgi:hypothetical protein
VRELKLQPAPKWFFTTGLLFFLICFIPLAEAVEKYPLVITGSPVAYQECRSNFKSFKEKSGSRYRIEVLDSVAASVVLLANPIQPIQLKPQVKSTDQLTLILDGLKHFFVQHGWLFHINEKNVVPASIEDHGDIIGVVFERGKYLGRPACGQTRGQIEFLVDKSKKQVLLLASTLTPQVKWLPDSATYPKINIRKKLMGREIRFKLNDKNIRFKIFRDDLIQFTKVCVYEKKSYKQPKTNQNGSAMMRLKSSTVHLAYEVVIANSFSTPIVTYYFDAITGEELGLEPPKKNLNSQ